LAIPVFPPSAFAVSTSILKGPDAQFNTAVFFIGSIGFSYLAYLVYQNSPGERAKGYQENIGLGEWYLGAYTGLSILPPSDWKFINSNVYPAGFQGRRATVGYDPGFVGGVKYGRYFDSAPWFGLEFESNVSRTDIWNQQLKAKPNFPGKLAPTLHRDQFYIWAMQSNLLARYGFFKDKEVPFGRLQPYVGVGPGFEVIYGYNDSAKNFAIETLVGLRYMLTPKISVFGEYKFSYQFAAEYEGNQFSNYPPKTSGQATTMAFDVPHHRFVFGIAYHFKNLIDN
jgi:opacity protein-like surface antigen